MENKGPLIIIAIGILSIAGIFVYAGANRDTSVSTATPPASTTSTEQQPQPEQPQQLSCEDTVSELQITDTLVGTGDVVEAGDTISIHYRGTTSTGEEFDSSYKRGQPYTLVIGAGEVIPGWDQGVPGMKVGGTRTLAIPSSLGYGKNPNGQIPPNCTLLFDLELVNLVKAGAANTDIATTVNGGNDGQIIG